MALIPLDEYLAKQRAAFDTVLPGPMPAARSGPSPTEQPGFISAPFQRGWKGVQADMTGAAGLAAEALGMDELSQGLYDKASEYAAARDAIPRRVPRMEDIHSMSDLGVFALETLIENAPLLATIAVPGGVAAKGIAMAGAGARAVEAGGAIASFLTDVGLQTGESVEIARQKGADPYDVRVIGSGLGKGVLDFVPLLTVAKRMGLLKGLPLGPFIEREISKTLVNGGYLARAAGEVGTIVAREVPTEVAQEAINIVLDRSYTKFHGALTDDEWSQLKNAAAGAAAFGLIGLPAAIGRPHDVDADEEAVTQLEEGAQKMLPPPEDLPALPPPGGGGGEQRRLPKPKPPDNIIETVYRVSPGGEVEAVPYSKVRGAYGNTNMGIFIGGPDGTITPSGTVDGNVVPYSLQPEKPDDLRVAIKRAMTDDQKVEQDQSIAFAGDGTVSSSFRPEALDLAARSVIALPDFLRSPVDNSIILTNKVLQEGKKRTRKVAATPLAEDPTPGQPQEIAKLLSLRDEYLNDPQLRRKSDGELSAQGKKIVGGVEAKIARASELLGVVNPLRQDTDVKQDAEATIQLANAEAAKPKVSSLSEGERQYLQVLEEKEVVEGLTDEEEKALDALYKKRVALRPTRVRRARPLTAHEIRALEYATDFQVQEGPQEGGFLSDGAPEGVERAQRQATSRDQTAAKTGGAKFTVEQVASAVRELTANFPNKPTFVVAPNTGVFRDIPSRKHLVAEKGTIHGMYFLNEPDTVYIFSDRVQSTQGLARTLLHEMFHFGIHNYMDAKERQQFLGLLGEQRTEIYQRVEANHKEILTATLVDPSAKNKARLNDAIMLEAEEMLAEIAEKNPKATVLDRVVAFFRRVLRRLMPSLKISDAEIRDIIHRVGAWSKKKPGVTDRNPRGLHEPFRARDFERAMGRRETYQETVHGIRELGEVWGQKFLNGVLTPLQQANSAYVKKTLPSVAQYMEFVQQWWARKRELTNTPVGIAEQWSKMDPGDSEKLAKAIFEISMQSDAKGERLTNAEIESVFVNVGLDPKQIVPSSSFRHDGSRNIFELWRDLDKSFQKIVDDMEKGIQLSVIRQAIRSDVTAPELQRRRAEELQALWRREPKHAEFFDEIAKAPELANLNLGARLLDIEGQMQRLRNRNYFPRMRFGKYAITVRAKQDMAYGGANVQGPTAGKRGEVLFFETHEGPAAQLNRRNELVRGEFGDSRKFEVQLTRLSDAEFVFLGMPPALYDVLRGELGLSTEQEERLKEIYRKFSPGSAFLKHLLRRKDVAGYSQDALRTYSSYMMNASNHVARVEFHQDLGDSLNGIRRESNLPENAVRAGELREYFARHYTYLMNPGNDWARLRSLGFLWYLGFNVKSALVNLTQVPMVAYPFLAQRYGDKAAFAALAKAYSDVAKMRRGKKILDADADRDLSRAIADGFVDESRATELAGLAEGDILQGLLPKGTGANLINKAAYYGSFLFRHAEKLNRETVFLAARELAKQRGLKGEAVYRAAREAVQTTMFEYAKWNRPEFMRGKKSVFFLFWNYMQHLAYLAYGGEGGKVAMRVWLGLMLAAGAQGLPFAENFFDIFDWGATEVKELTGSSDPRTDIRGDLRNLANTITDQPDMIMHGLGRYYGLGPMHFLQLFDVPVPNVDVSGSLSAGEVLPGLREALSAQEDPDAKLGKVVVDALGPIVGIGYNFWRAMADDNPDSWKVWERAMPTAISNVSKAFRRQTVGEQFRGGGDVVEFAPQNMEHRAENIAQALGFAPTRLNERQELRYSQEQLKQYWTARRAMLMESYAYALMARNSEAVDRATKKIEQFNGAVPSKVLAINQDQLHQSVKQRYRRATLRENGIPAENSFRPLYRRIEQQFPEGSAAIAGRFLREGQPQY